MQPEVKLDNFIRDLKDPETVSPANKNNGSLTSPCVSYKIWAYNDFDPKDLVSAVTSEIALDHLLPAIFARGEGNIYQHLATAHCPPGCEDLPKDQWREQFYEPCISPEDIDDIPLEVRLMHDSYASARDKCMQDLYDERLEDLQ